MPKRLNSSIPENNTKKDRSNTSNYSINTFMKDKNILTLDKTEHAFTNY